MNVSKPVLPRWRPCFPFLLQPLPLPLHHLPPTYPSLSLHDNNHQPHGSRLAALYALCYSPSPARTIIMSLVVGSREAAGGATVGIRGGGQGSGLRFSPSPVFLESEESSSIGFGRVSSEEDGDDGEEEVESGLSCLNALEESLPIKRGLSSYFLGKSKSFASLSDVASQTSVKELAKLENPYNKRRRILVASRSGWSRGASLNASMPQLPAELEKTEGNEEEDEEGEDSEEEEEEESRDQLRPTIPMKLHSQKFKTIGSSRSYSLSDLRNA